jgi:uncharacterized protein YjbI with pentapeptide repeats
MANPEHLAILKQGVEVWNQWREENRGTLADLSGADLTGASLIDLDLRGVFLQQAHLTGADISGADLSGAKLSGADLSGASLVGAYLDGANLAGVNLAGADLQRAKLVKAYLSGGNLVESDFRAAYLYEAHLVNAELVRSNLSEAKLIGADLSGANLAGARLIRSNLRGAKLARTDLSNASLSGAYLSGANLIEANLDRADLSDADLIGADLTLASLTDADLSRANLRRATLDQSNLSNATLNDCQVYGISAWGLLLPPPEKQRNLRITTGPGPAVTVDNLELAQFVYLLLHNEKIRGVVDTIGRKGVLILGRFYDERKRVLDAVKDRLRELDLVPIVFDWDKPTKRDLTETVQLLANMSRFVVADVTDAKSIPQELSSIVPHLPSVPVRPIMLAGEREYAMFEHWTGYNTMLPVFEYDDRDHLIENMEKALIRPVEEWEAGYDKTKALEEENARLRAELAAREADG